MVKKHSLKLTASSHLKIGLNAPKGNDRIPTIHFQGCLLLVPHDGWVFRVGPSPHDSGLAAIATVGMLWDDVLCSKRHACAVARWCRSCVRCEPPT